MRAGGPVQAVFYYQPAKDDEVRQVEKALPPEGQGCLLLDDCIIEKAYADENGLVTVPYDHSQDRY
jgi:hypothetical protein